MSDREEATPTSKGSLGRFAEQMSDKAQAAVQRVSGSEGGSTPSRSAGQRAAGGAAAAPRRTPPGQRPAPGRRPRTAHLRLTQVDAWSVMKTAFLLSVAMGIVMVVAMLIVWIVLDAAGVFDSINSMVQQILTNNFKVQDYLGVGRVFGFTLLLAVVNVFLMTAIATLAAFLYNLTATLVGGVEMTLAEDR